MPHSSVSWEALTLTLLAPRVRLPPGCHDGLNEDALVRLPAGGDVVVAQDSGLGGVVEEDAEPVPRLAVGLRGRHVDVEGRDAALRRVVPIHLELKGGGNLGHRGRVQRGLG